MLDVQPKHLLFEAYHATNSNFKIVHCNCEWCLISFNERCTQWTVILHGYRLISGLPAILFQFHFIL